jgi:hypothetical protein
LESVLGNWADVAFRKTLLLLGIEESTFYAPAEVPLEVRAMVVVAIRNSMIENLSATRPFVPALRRFAEPMPDALVPNITRKAILFFAPQPHSETGWGVGRLKRKDVFREIANDFPESWKRLHALAVADGQEVQISGCGTVGLGGRISKGQETEACVSGYMPEFTSEEARIFREASSEPGKVFFTHSFKWFTRNPSKLLRGMETMIGAGGAFITSNYYVSQGYCARRVPLMRPAHTVPQLRTQVSDVDGLVGRHKTTIQDITR